MEVLRSGSLFSDILQEIWRHQLGSYKIISFYEGIGEIVSRSSAVLELPGDIENQVKIDADHSEMCRFDLSVAKDHDNYRLVQANIEDLYDLDIGT
ncbi:hypothetical protein ABVK25_008868 [Lepraria finkii]|uniref:Uncharacterized protein n=1 Tax=Lepraria finkii TaxID=1340010 RepID=A0ABR4B0R8_9LECA